MAQSPKLVQHHYPEHYPQKEDGQSSELAPFFGDLWKSFSEMKPPLANGLNNKFESVIDAKNISTKVFNSG